jgi:hypothetical protein
MFVERQYGKEWIDEEWTDEEWIDKEWTVDKEWIDKKWTDEEWFFFSTFHWHFFSDE